MCDVQHTAVHSWISGDYTASSVPKLRSLAQCGANGSGALAVTPAHRGTAAGALLTRDVTSAVLTEKTQQPGKHWFL